MIAMLCSNITTTNYFVEYSEADRRASAGTKVLVSTCCALVSVSPGDLVVLSTL